GAELPWITAVVVAMSEFVQKYVFLIFAGLVAALPGLPLLPEHDRRGAGQTDTPPAEGARSSATCCYKVAMTRVTRTLAHPHLRRRAHARGPQDHLDDGRQRRHREARSSRPASSSPRARP
ncbi:MAG: hypothetical protein MZU91_00780, partial [Desulfosudis oleivorans]|nr:hypothetical protein [Desulfosudis oleivorans]